MASSTNHNSDFWPSLYEQLRGSAMDSHEWFSLQACARATSDAYLIRIELPGVMADDINVRAEKNSVMVEGTKTKNPIEKDDMQFFDERLYGRFVRSFKLPDDADVARFKVSLKDGILLIEIPRLRAATPEGIHPDHAS